jgi:hypothetical protein
MKPARLGSSPWLTVPLSLAAVGAFALAQPVLDLLGRNPEFFIARGFTAIDVLLFPALLLLLPALLSLPVLALRWIGPRTAGIGHAIVIGALFSLFVANAWVAVFGSNTSPVMFGAGVFAAGITFGCAFLAFPPVQIGTVYAAWAVPLFAAWFLFMTPSGDVALARSGDLPDPGEIENPVPIVLLVFDEFPVATMIDSQGNLLSELFPNFAELAGDGVWYRNAVGVRQQTEEALPTILSGVGADEGSIPISSDHPLNLFTLLSDAYDIAAVETVTNLCPDFACSNSSRRIDPWSKRWTGLGVDAAVVYGHLTTPRDVSDDLPPINQTWGNFTTGERSSFDIIDRFLANVDDDRRLEVDRLLDTFEFDEAEPALRFGHFLYPHHPWEVIADGHRTGAGSSPGAEGMGWTNDTWLVGQGYQRHILQTQYADTVVGKVIDRLRDEGVYDEALVMVVADHGITIGPGVDNQRLISEDTIGTIAAVPMFVKYPNGQEGVEPGTIDDARAETVDILPTIGDVTRTDVPWVMEGLSLLDPERSERTESVMVGRDGPVSFGVGGEEKLAAAALKETWFPGGDPWQLTPPGWQEWLGRPLSDGAAADDEEEVMATVRQQELLDDVPSDPDLLPVFLSGTLTLDREATGQEIVVVAVDDVVRAVTRVFEPDGRSARFEVMIPPDLLHPGQNDVVLWLAEGDAPDPAFVR